MRRLTSYVTRAFVILLLVAASAPVAPTQDPHPAKCCFTNPAYAGTCEVEPAKEETCSSILGYLNNPMSQGKAYCGNTTIRGGWQSVVCEPKQ
jgi:hypothetical protein